MKKIKIILIILITLFVVLPFISNNLINVKEKKQDNNKNSNINNSYTTKNHATNLKTSKSWHNFTFIHITGANWSKAASYDWVSGSGTFNTPYVLENITIDAGGLTSGILIEDSSVYFRIKNCTVYNSGAYNAGIKLVNVTNGNLINNTLNYNYNGIRLEENSYNNTISLNTANYNEYAGIYLYECNRNNISLNTANYNEYAGIAITFKSNNNSVSQNTANYNDLYGIWVFYHSKNNSISQNTANYNSYGITLSGKCDYNNLSRNTANGNNNDGINLLYTSNNNTISENTANYNIHGIYLYTSNNNTVSGNTLVANVYFIEENDCINNIIKYNTCYTVILPSGTREFKIKPYRVEDIDASIRISLLKDTKVLFSGFYNNILNVPLDNGLIFMNLQLNDTSNLNQSINTPINIILKYDVNKYEEIEAFWFNDPGDGDGAWVSVHFIDLGNGLIVISVNHTSIFALIGRIPLSSSEADEGNINMFLIIIIAFFICIVSSITASSTYYYKKRSKTRGKPTKKETLRKIPLVKNFNEKVVKSRNLKDYVEKENLLRVLKEKNALENPALFHDLKFNAVSNGFWEKLDKLELNEEDFNNFLNEMLALTPEERQRIIYGMLKLSESDSENATKQEYN